MIYLQLFTSFFKIGLFSFGGGYGMIPMIQKELQINNWISGQDFIKIISISEMTPGPIAVNTATFIGYKTAGFLGGAVATLGVGLPSFILIISTAYILNKYKTHPLLGRILYGIKPVVLALIIGAIFFVGRNTMFKHEINVNILNQPSPIMYLINNIDPVNVFILIISLLMLLLLKIHPIFVLLISGILGVIFHYIGII
jgi:chromate transporter